MLNGDSRFASDRRDSLLDDVSETRTTVERHTNVEVFAL